MDEDIVSLLEDNSSVECFDCIKYNPGLTVPDILKLLNLWLITECKNKIRNLNSSEIIETQKFLKQLRQSANIVICDARRIIESREQDQEELSFLCNVCGAEVRVEKGKSIWSCFQGHDHIEEQYVRFLMEKGNFEAAPLNVTGTLNGCVDESLVDAASSVFISDEVESDDNASSNFTRSNCNGTIRGSGEKMSNGLLGNENIPSTTLKTDQVNETAGKSLKKPDNSFRFNFQLSYDKTIERILYPAPLMAKVRSRDNLPVYTIQYVTSTTLYCLLCNCEMPYSNDHQSITRATQNILTHVGGQKHSKLAKNPDAIACLKAYHNNWNALDTLYQAHQVHFEALNLNETYCHMCKLQLSYSELSTHIDSEKHKALLFAMWEYIDDLDVISRKQAEVYGKVYPKSTAMDSEPESDESLSTSQKTSPDDNTSVADSASPAKLVAKHDIVASVVNSTSNNPVELLENRFKNHLPKLKLNGKMVQCICCVTELVADVDQIRSHILKLEHRQNAGVANKKFLYYCEICNLRYQSENKWQQHLGLPAHKTKCQSLGSSRREKIKEYECRTCRCVIFGDDISLSRHKKHYNYKAKKKEVKLPEAVKMLFRSENYMEEFAAHLVDEANIVTSTGQNVMNCCRALEIALSELYENCKAYPFGSRVSGLGNQLSDLDVFVDVGGMYTGELSQDPASQENFVKKTSKVLRKLKNSFSSVNPIPTARTPIVQVYHRPTDLDCDLSFRHGLSVENTDFLRKCIEMQPIVRCLILTLKKWFLHTSLRDYITTYALSMMVIFYMQTNKHLLSVKELRELNPSESVIINGWQTIKYTATLDMLKLHIKPYNNSLKKALMGFFIFYCNFGYATDVICPLMGHTVPKSSFQKPELLPQEMSAYVFKLNSDPEPEYLRIMSPLCIQDPFDLSHNLTKACPQGIVDKFKKLCDLTYNHLLSIN